MNNEFVPTREFLEEALEHIKNSGESGAIYLAGQVGETLGTLISLGCVRAEECSPADPAMGSYEVAVFGPEQVRLVYERELPKKTPSLRDLIETGDKVRLGEDCNAPGELATVEDIRDWGVVCYIPHPSDSGQKKYYRIKFGAFELVDSGSTKH